VNLEDSVKKLLPRMMKEMGWSNREVIGALCCVWGATQDAEIIDTKFDRLVTVCAVEFDDDAQCEKFLNAMIGVRLITLLDSGLMHIKGNEVHVSRLQQLRGSASKGGEARQKKLNDFVASSLAQAKHTGASTQPYRSAPYSLLLTPFSEEERNTNTENSKKPKRRPRTPTAPAASPTGFADVVSCWFEHYERKYQKKPKWGPRQGAQLKQLMLSYKAEELINQETGLIRHFFAWKRPEVIKAGHSFGKGHSCFILKIEELEADMAAPERRAEAAAIVDLERKSDEHAAEQAQTQRIVHEVEPDAYATGRINRKCMESLGTFGTGAPGEFLPPPRAASRQEAHGGQPVLVRETLVTVGKGGQALPSDSNADGRRSDAKHQTHQGSDWPTAGVTEGASSSTTHARGAQAK
jgi:hypothetical protein